MGSVDGRVQAAMTMSSTASSGTWVLSSCAATHLSGTEAGCGWCGGVWSGVEGLNSSRSHRLASLMAGAMAGLTPVTDTTIP